MTAARKPARAWTAADTAAMVELAARNWTDGEIARALGVVRLTVWRRRTALGLARADHPRKENRPLVRDELRAPEESPPCALRGEVAR